MENQTEFKSFRVQEGKSNIVYLLIVLAVALIAGLLIFAGSRSNKPEISPVAGNKTNNNLSKLETRDASNPEPLKVEVVPAKDGELPQGFPEISLNGKKELTSSYALQYPGADQEQKVIDFTSSNSVKENFAFYKDWAGKNGWKVMHESDNDQESRIIIEQDKKPLTITIKKDAGTSSKVNLSW